MKKYKVTIFETAVTEAEVYAKSRDEAIQTAERENKNGVYEFNDYKFVETKFKAKQILSRQAGKKK